MMSRQRFDAIAKGTKPDRVGLMCQLSWGHYVQHSGIAPADYFLDYGKVCPDVYINMMKRYGFDGCVVEFPGHDSEAMRAMVGKIVDHNGGQSIIFKNGDEIFCPRNEEVIFRPKAAKPTKNVTTVKADELMPHMGYKTKVLPDCFLHPYHEIIGRVSETHSVHGSFTSPTSMFLHSMGLENGFCALMDEPERCEEILAELAEACILWVETQIVLGCTIIGISAPYEGSSFISRRMYDRFVLPYTAKVVSHIKARNIPTYMHTCGFIRDRLEALVETGVDGIECLDPPPIGDVELTEAVKRIGGKVFIKGNMDSVNVLMAKTPREVYDYAVDHIKTAKETERYILSSACSVAPDTPPENLEVLIKAVEDYGYYS